MNITCAHFTEIHHYCKECGGMVQWPNQEKVDHPDPTIDEMKVHMAESYLPCGYEVVKKETGSS